MRVPPIWQGTHGADTDQCEARRDLARCRTVVSLLAETYIDRRPLAENALRRLLPVRAISRAGQVLTKTEPGVQYKFRYV